LCIQGEVVEKTIILTKTTEIYIIHNPDPCAEFYMIPLDTNPGHWKTADIKLKTCSLLSMLVTGRCSIALSFPKQHQLPVKLILAQTPHRFPERLIEFIGAMFAALYFAANKIDVNDDFFYILSMR